MLGVSIKTVADYRRGIGLYSEFRQFVPSELVAEHKPKEGIDLSIILPKVPEKTIQGASLREICATLLSPAGPIWFNIPSNKKIVDEILKTKRELPLDVQKRIDEIIKIRARYKSKI
jgi:tRNA G26 N,N-dimethylase Trm1